MRYKEQFIRLLTSSVRIFLILSLGSFILYTLTSYLFSELEFTYLILLIPIMLVVLFGMVAFVLSEILQLQSINRTEGSYQYTRKEMFSLFGRSFLVVACGGALALLFGYKQQHGLQAFPDYLFYAFDFLLTLYAIGNIVKGEKLRELNLRRIQSENALLKSQLNPHFLYNTLNNIDALITYDTEKASEAVLTLSSLLRYMTYQGNQRFVSLREEVAHLKEYVELQRLRLENPQAILFETHFQTEDVKIAPMLLMPFIENIFKHASCKGQDNTIHISLNTDLKTLSFQTRNEIRQTITAKPKESGVGLYVVKRRLKLLYPNQHTLQIEQVENQYIVSLSLNFK